ncbi:MAG: hypothetical protein JEY94_06810 [Melioribacteraceae bacterium]|nr:hypothetical protein [Melioribacteraceae bacterium]
MKHFVVEISYTVDFEKIKEVLDEHRSFLQIGYDKNMLLCSGPQEPLTGGIAIAKAESLEDIVEFFENDPYNKAGYTEYLYTEFNPVKFQDFMGNWVSEN